jgi:hypothetical protein
VGGGGGVFSDVRLRTAFYHHVQASNKNLHVLSEEKTAHTQQRAIGRDAQALKVGVMRGAGPLGDAVGAKLDDNCLRGNEFDCAVGTFFAVGDDRNDDTACCRSPRRCLSASRSS